VVHCHETIYGPQAVYPTYIGQLLGQIETYFIRLTHNHARYMLISGVVYRSMTCLLVRAGWNRWRGRAGAKHACASGPAGQHRLI
jgi:hypothetical protein